MPDPRNDTPKPEPSEARQASLEDLVAALGDPNASAEPEDLDPTDEVQADGESDAAEAEPEADPYAEYADLDLATSLPIDPDDDLSKLSGEASPRLMSIVESLLFAASKPMTVKDIRRLLKEPTKRQIQLALKQLIFDTQHRGVVLGQVAGGFRLRTHPDNAAFVQKMMAGRPVRLSRSQLESLAVVAYRQPVTKAELDHVRGVDCGAVLRVLLERDLVKIVGRKEEAGRPHLYGTTVSFLEFFNLKGLRDLPDLHEFRELNEESQATLKHSMDGNLSAEQEAMGQGTLDFADGEGPGADGDGDGDGVSSEDGSASAAEGGESRPDVSGDDDGAGSPDADAPATASGPETDESAPSSEAAFASESAVVGDSPPSDGLEEPAADDASAEARLGSDEASDDGSGAASEETAPLRSEPSSSDASSSDEASSDEAFGDDSREAGDDRAEDTVAAMSGTAGAETSSADEVLLDGGGDTTPPVDDAADPSTDEAADGLVEETPSEARSGDGAESSAPVEVPETDSDGDESSQAGSDADGDEPTSELVEPSSPTATHDDTVAAEPSHDGIPAANASPSANEGLGAANDDETLLAANEAATGDSEPSDPDADEDTDEDPR